MHIATIQGDYPLAEHNKDLVDNRSWSGISRNLLKMIAITTITVGHFFLYTFSKHRCFGASGVMIGLMTMVCFIGPPIFMFFIAEGFRYTSSKMRYGRRLLIFSLITQLIFAVTTADGLGFDVMRFFFAWNVFFALFIGFLDLCILNSKMKLPVRILLVAATLALTYFLSAEWMVFGPLMIIAFYYLKDRKIIAFIVAELLVYLTFFFADCGLDGSFQLNFLSNQMKYILPYSAIGIFLVLFLYKGRNGKKNKFIQYFFYVFYPLHLLLIDLVLLLV